MDWHQVKDWMERASGLDPDALHIFAGTFLQLFVAVLLRRSLRSFWPWLIVLGVEFTNEVYDYTYEVWPNRDIQFAEGLRDMWNTMVVPTLLLLIARHAPRLLTRPVSGADPG